MPDLRQLCSILPEEPCVNCPLQHRGSTRGRKNKRTALLPQYRLVQKRTNKIGGGEISAHVLPGAEFSQSLITFSTCSSLEMGGSGSKQAQLDKFGQLLSVQEKEALNSCFAAVAGSPDAESFSENKLQVRKPRKAC